MLEDDAMGIDLRDMCGLDQCSDTMWKGLGGSDRTRAVRRLRVIYLTGKAPVVALYRRARPGNNPSRIT